MNRYTNSISNRKKGRVGFLMTGGKLEVCIICQEIIEKIGGLACLHHFCFECINKWLANSGTCPLCRHECSVITDRFGVKHNLLKPPEAPQENILILDFFEEATQRLLIETLAVEMLKISLELFKE
jgi:hypothetical protein